MATPVAKPSARSRSSSSALRPSTPRPATPRPSTSGQFTPRPIAPRPSTPGLSFLYTSDFLNPRPPPRINAPNAPTSSSPSRVTRTREAETPELKSKASLTLSLSEQEHFGQPSINLPGLTIPREAFASLGIGQRTSTMVVEDMKNDGELEEMKVIVKKGENGGIEERDAIHENGRQEQRTEFDNEETSEETRDDVLNPLPSLSTPNIFHGKAAGDPQHNE
ncbi:hypothetical protein CJF32_00009341 [Rutstroemia sp. NJR-2017a WRK4]|nr:hypothetical protein CJF32_00009341 [Rutstroemia sp. NJR-2017a WRK4]